MMSADLKTSIIQQEIKGLVAHLTNFIHELYLKSNANSGCICHLILVCILSILILSVKNREGGWFLLNGKNRLSIFVDIQSLSCIVPRPSALLGYIPTRIYRKQKIRNKKYKKVLTFLAFIFRSSFEAIKRNKSLTILPKRQFKCDQLFIIKIKVI